VRRIRADLTDSPGVTRAATLATMADRMRGRGFIDDTGQITNTGRETRERIEALTDELAAPAYDVLSADELDELITGLEPIAAAAKAAND
jgi:ABC-type transporter Mla subunit MlaD